MNIEKHLAQKQTNPPPPHPQEKNSTLAIAGFENPVKYLRHIFSTSKSGRQWGQENVMM